MVGGSGEPRTGVRGCEDWRARVWLARLHSLHRSCDDAVGLQAAGLTRSREAAKGKAVVGFRFSVFGFRFSVWRAADGSPRV